ncbi:MAG: PIG-L family deacetylase [Xanthomonadaceae bacterium]|nr:PIG-L family deacetylase [Xanthomonadaceae bacterium]MDE3071742.1 PIG-L family deacetylase [Pseudomonadota bacterium]
MALTAGVASQQPAIGWADEPPAFSARTRLLVVAPHPDDETLATGLLIQQVRAAGGEVQVLLLTAGDNNPWPQRWLERRVRIRGADRRRWGQRRLAEMQHALRQLDLPAPALRSLGWPDMGVTDGLLQSGGELLATLAGAIGEFRPSLIALPSLHDRHPDHGTAHVLVRLAVARLPHPPAMLAYLVHGRTLGVRFVEIRGSAGQQACKQRALAAYRSQLALSGNRLRRLAAPPERYAMVPPRPGRPASALPWQPPAWLQPWLRLSVVGGRGAQSWRWRDAPLRRDGDGVYQLPPARGPDDIPRFARLAWDLHSVWVFDHWGWHEL